MHGSPLPAKLQTETKPSQALGLFNRNGRFNRNGLRGSLPDPEFAGFLDLPLDDLAPAFGLHPREEADFFEPFEFGSPDFYLHFSTFVAVSKKSKAKILAAPPRESSPENEAWRIPEQKPKPRDAPIRPRVHPLIFG